MIRIDKEIHQKLSYCHYKHLQPLLKKRIESISKKEYFDKDKKVPINQAIKDCLQYIQDNLQKILLADSEELKELIQYFNANYPCLTTDYKKDNKPPLYTIVYTIFVSNGYSDYFSKTYKEKIIEKVKTQIEKKYHAYKFIEELNIGTCPYCNRNYISSVSIPILNQTTT